MVISAKFASGFIQNLSALGVEVWLDGGWGVDALLGLQSRPHDDLDIVVADKDLRKALNMLEEDGFVPVPRPDTRPWNFVLSDTDGRDVDFHVVVFDSAGNGVYSLPENGEAYPAEAFSGRGFVNGVPVKCMSATSQIANKQDHELRDKDHHDLRLLRAKLGIA